MWSWVTAHFRNTAGYIPADATHNPAMPPDAMSGKDRVTAFTRLRQQWPHMAPQDATIGAFLAWLRELGEAGSWEQAELRDEYEHICWLTGEPPMSKRWFGKALEGHGCHRWQAYMVIDGQRRRPMFVYVPEQTTEAQPQAQTPGRKTERLRIVQTHPSHFPSRLVGGEASQAFAA